jgi:IS605 OrfB family transposase
MLSKKNLLQYDKLFSLLETNNKIYLNLLLKKKIYAIKHLPEKENIINILWKRCYLVFIILIKSKYIRSKTLLSIISPKNKWDIFLVQLTELNSNENILHKYLFQCLLQELIIIQKENESFWNPKYNILSNKLLSPIKNNNLESTIINKNLSLTIKNINIQNNNCNNYFDLSTSKIINNWKTKQNTVKYIKKTLKIPLQINQKQQIIIDEWINTSNYVYNKTLEKIKLGLNPNWMNLRDMLVINKTKKNTKEYKSFDEIFKILREQKKEYEIELESNKNNQYTKYLKDILNTFDITIKKLNQDRRDAVKKVKSEKNININNWELLTPKEIRTYAVKEVCNAYKTGFSQLKTGKIKYFNLNYRKKTNNNKCVSIPKSLISIINNTDIKIAPTFFKDNNNNKNKDDNNDEEDDNEEDDNEEDDNENFNYLFKIGKYTLHKNKNLLINHDCKIVKQKNKYWLLIPQSIEVKEKKKPINYCGIDPGVRTFMTTFGNNESLEYNHNKQLLDKLNKEILFLKQQRTKKIKNIKNIKVNKKRKNHCDEEQNISVDNITTKNIYERIRKKAFVKREEKKINIINELHWNTINDLLIKNDVIFYGDIKSHDIVHNGNNKILNKSFNDLKFYKFKQRLLYKASIENKLVFCVNEAYTTQTCSFCGNKYKPECSKIYDCIKCKNIIDRDINAAKNILMKGIIINL